MIDSFEEEKIIIAYEEEKFVMYDGLGVNKKVNEIINLDDRFLALRDDDKVILWPYTVVEEDKRVREIVAPYKEFIDKHLIFPNIKFCSRCSFGIFDYLSEGKRGEWHRECDNPPQENCSNSVYKKFDVPCQQCDYSLCNECEYNSINTDNVEFNILLSAVLLNSWDLFTGKQEMFDRILTNFPGSRDYIPEIIIWLEKCVCGEIETTTYHEPWAVMDSWEIKSILKHLRGEL